MMMKLFSLALLLSVGAASAAEVPAAGHRSAATFVDLNACWTRRANAQADALGLPAKICLSRVGVTAGATSMSGSLTAEGTPFSGSFKIVGATLGDHRRTLTGTIYIKETAKKSCGTLNYAAAALSVDVDRGGALVADPKPEITAFLLETGGGCGNQEAPAVDLVYTRAR